MAGQAHLPEPFMTHREGPVSMMRKNRWHRGKWRPTSWGFRQRRPCVPRTRRSSKSWNLSRTKSAGACPGRRSPKRPSERLDLPRPRVDDDDRDGDPGHVRRDEGHLEPEPPGTGRHPDRGRRLAGPRAAPRQRIHTHLRPPRGREPRAREARDAGPRPGNPRDHRRYRVTSRERPSPSRYRRFSWPKNLQIGSLASCRSMLDVRLVRENPEVIRKDLAKRHAPDKAKLLDSVIQWDKEWRKALAEGDALKRRRNEITKEIAAAKKADENADKLRKEAAALPKKIAALDLRIEELAGQVRDGLLRLPNLLHESVPVGKDDSENVEVSRWGTPRTLDFELRPHGELLEALRLADFERARKIAGAGFVYPLGDLVRLDQALLAFALGYMVKQGFTPVFPPLMMRRSAYEGVVDLGDFESVMYKVDGEDLYLIATSEHPLGAMYMDEVIDVARWPVTLPGLGTRFGRRFGPNGGAT